jgi:hypothetical protein
MGPKSHKMLELWIKYERAANASMTFCQIQNDSPEK